MENLSYEKLIETYVVAKRVGLAEPFIQLIEQEFQRRQMTLEEIYTDELKRRQKDLTI